MKGISIKMKSIERASWIYGVILALIFGLSLYIRALPYDSIFGGAFVRFGGNDPWYNMRLVENTLHNFPHRIYFDALTHYPHGTNVPFAPLFDYLLAVIIWIVGLGKPFATLGQHGIEVIGAWYPAVLGALTIIPVYFIGKELWNRNAGLLSAALIAILPGQFLSRSLLGFTDHHVAETLFSTIAMLFFILAVKSAKKNEITFYSVMGKDWNALKKPMIYSFLGGISLGSYYLSWKGAPLFVFVLLIYAVVQYILDHVRGKSTDYLCVVAVPAFLVSLVMIAPVLHPGALEKFHVISLLLGVVVFGALSAVSFLMNYRKIDLYGYPVAILALGVISFVLLNVLNPSLYSALTGQLRIFVPTMTQLTVAEIHPMRVFGTSIAHPGAWEWFTTTFFIAFAAFLWIGYNIARKFRAEEVLFIVWSAVILYACFGQNRFAAYYAVNVALLSGFVSWKIIEFVVFRREERGGGRGGKVKGKKKGGAGGGNVQKAKPKAKATDKEKRTKAEKIEQYLRADIIITFIIIFFVVFYPPLFSTPDHGKAIGSLYPRGSGGPETDWYNSLLWMRENTPDPCVDYYALYEEPSLNETTGKREDYNYPESAYSVMSWWDYGHWITRIGHRIPFANPFQQGAPQAAEYLIETDESKANEILDEFGTKYVITDFLMVDFMGASYHPKYVMPTWAGKSPNPWLTIEARLHMFDGSETSVEEGVIPYLQHYRLVHESSLYLLPFMVIDSETNRTLYWRAYYGSYRDAKSQADIVHIGARISGQEDKIAYTPAFVNPVSFVKIFEYVKGARIEGTAPDGSIVEIATNVTTNQGREFVYSAMKMSNGSYEFIVPYSTEGPIEGGTNFDVFAAPYKIRAGHVENATVVWDVEKEVSVPEEVVMEGKTIRVEL